MAMINEKMLAIMNDVEAIEKDRKNDKQNYKFRGVDDVYQGLHAIMAKHGVFTTSKIVEHSTEERKTNSGGALIYRVLRIVYTFRCADGSSVETEVIGEGMDSGDKASNKAMSVAHKYALLQAFMIPTEDLKDPENDSPAVAPKQTVSKDQDLDLVERMQTAKAKNIPQINDLIEKAKKTWSAADRAQREQIVKSIEQQCAIYSISEKNDN